MAWVKIPIEHHALFLAAVPADRRVQTLQMFGGVAGKVNGHMFGGLFGRSVMVKLAPADQALAMQLDGSEPFDPMGTGRAMTDSVLLAEEVMDDPVALRDWLDRAFRHVATLPAKPAKQPKNKAAKAARPAKPKAKAVVKAKAATVKSKPAKRAPARKKPKPR